MKRLIIACEFLLMKLRKGPLYALDSRPHKIPGRSSTILGYQERCFDQEYYHPFDELGRRSGKSKARLDSIIPCPGTDLWALATLCPGRIKSVPFSGSYNVYMDRISGVVGMLKLTVPSTG